MAHKVTGLRRRGPFAAGLVIALVASLIPVVSVAAVGTNLSFTVFPPNPATAGVPFNVTVHVQDNAAAALQGVQVTLDIRPDHNPGSDTLTCTSGTALNSGASGNATFTGCRINNPGQNYELRARASGATTVFTPDFDVQLGGADHLIFSSYPASSTSFTLAPQPTVQVVDATGHVITTNNSTVVTIAKAPGTPTSGGPGTLVCTNPGGLSRTVVNGTATFSGCTINAVGVGYRLRATSSPTLTAATGNAFNVTSPPTKLQVCWGTAATCNTTPPTNISGGSAFSLQSQIRVLDASNNLVTGDSTTSVTLSILGGTPATGGPGTLTCTGGLSKTVTNGIANFAGCAIDKTGTGYRLNASSVPALTSAASNTFNIALGAPVKLGFVSQPPATATAQSPFASNVQVAIVDAGGNVVSTGITATINLAIATNPGAGVLSCAGGNSATTVNRVATFTGCTINNQGNGYTLVASAVATAPVTALANATSTAINVLAPAAAITLSAPTVIKWGDDMTLSVHFGVNGANKAFTIQVSKDGVNWSNIAGASLTTNASGDASFIYGPSDNRYYRASFAGTPGLQAGTSNVVRTVVRQINLLRPAPTSRYKTIGHGTAITFSSTIRPNRPELPQAVAHFVVYRFITGEGWTRVVDRMVPVDRGNGVASLRLTFNSTGKFYVRSEAVPTAFNANSGWSGLVRYIVR